MELNMQPPEKPVDNPDALDIINIWHTIQGEGPYAGVPAVFIRLAGCNIRCDGCDTQYTAGRRMMKNADIVTAVRDLIPPDTIQNCKKYDSYPLIVITGGEPFRQNFSELARSLVYTGHTVQVETNGTLWQEEIWPSRFHIVVSPKTPTVSKEIARRAMAWKYVLRHDQIDADGLPLTILGGARPARPPEKYSRFIYIQPEDTKDPDLNRKNMEACINVSKRYGYRLGVQLHKDIGQA